MRKLALVALLLALVMIPELATAAAQTRTSQGVLSPQARDVMSITVTLTSPTGVEKLTRAGSCSIKWTFKGNPGASVNIFLMQGTTTVRTLALNQPIANGQFTWQIDKDITLGDNFYIVVQSQEHPKIMGKSNIFSVFQPGLSAGATHGPVSPYTPPQVTVTHPEQGATWAAGDPQSIEWQYSGDPPGQAKVLLMKNNQVIKTISAGQSWGQWGKGYIIPYYMPSDVPPGSGYVIKVVSTTDDKYRGTSGQFTITPYARLIVTQPANNAPLANWPVGSVHTLTWTYSGNCGTHVKIELHGGVNDGWKIYLLATSVPIGANGSGSFQWTVPPSGTNGITWIPGNQYQIMIAGIENQKCWDWTGMFTVSQ
jgi:hypothetical protein